jgi:hypothetical protein
LNCAAFQAVEPDSNPNRSKGQGQKRIVNKPIVGLVVKEIYLALLNKALDYLGRGPY